MNAKKAGWLVVAMASLFLAGFGDRADAAGYQMAINFTGYTNRSETLTNFPVLVVLSNNVGGSGLNFVTQPFLSTNGWDLRFRDAADTTNLNYEIEQWKTNGPCYVWVQVPALAADGTGSILARWGYDSTQQLCTTNGATWNSGFRSVWHFGTTNGVIDMRDSTANRYHGTVGTAATGPSSTNAAIAGTAAAFNSNMMLAGPSSAYIPAVNAPICVSCWIQPSSIATGNLGNRFFELYRDTSGNGSHIGAVGDTNRVQCWFNDGTTAVKIESSNSYAAGNWYYITCLHTGAVGYLYGNGTLDNSLPGTMANGSTSALTIGGSLYNNALGSPYSGAMDEMRISSVVRSTNWIWAEYMNMASNATAFQTYGGATPMATSLPIIANQDPTGITTNSAFMNGVLSSNGSSQASVTLYWGTNDAAANLSAWASTNTFGLNSQPCPVTYTTNITGLVPATTYYYRYYAANSTTNALADPAKTFTTLAIPAVNNAGGATNINATYATLQGQVTAGYPVPAVYFCWGTNNAGTTSGTGAWQNVTSAGTAPGVFSNFVGGLTPATVYYYASYATNAAGGAWAGVTNFLTVAGTAYTATNSGNWNTSSTWNPSTGFPRYSADTALIASNTVSPVAYPIPTIGLINLTTNATGSKTGTLYFADATAQSAPLQLNGGTLQLINNGTTMAQPANAVTVKAGSQISMVGTATRDTQTMNFNGSFQDWVQAGVTNRGMIFLRGSGSAGMNLSASSPNYSGGWDVMVGPQPGWNGGSLNPALNLWADGALGSGTAIVRNALNVCASQTNAPTPARVIVLPGAELWAFQDWNYYGLTLQNWEIELQGGTLGSGKFQASQMLGGHIYMTSNSTFYGHRDGRVWTPDFRYGGTIVGTGRLTIDADRYETDTQIFRLSGTNSSFSGGVTILWNRLYVECTNALGTGDCWFDSADPNSGGVYLNTTPATTNWVLQNNFGGIGKLQVQDGSATYTLTTPGTTIQPGTNVNVPGQLTIAGNLAFGTNGAGGRSTLMIDVTGTNGVAGVDFDQLAVTRTLTNLNNAALVVNLATNLANGSLNGQTLIVATNAATLASTFASVRFNGSSHGSRWRGTVTYNQPAGTVTLSTLSAPPGGSAIFVR